MSVFIHAQGVKTVHGGDQKMAKFCLRSCWMTPKVIPKTFVLNFTVWIISSSVYSLNFSRVHTETAKSKFLKNVTNSWPLASNLQNIFLVHFSPLQYPGKIQITLEKIVLTVSQYNCSNKIPLFTCASGVQSSKANKGGAYEILNFSISFCV